ncbi:hypothetical protein H0H87_007415 [Tephrocybe sp. NHM501043]|nr:hypothetical protein H0H87_007415 [Tephrocybe sp. NHM501043]
MLLAGVGAGLTLQTSTVAAQASVARRDMSVVTAFRNFIRLLGGTLSLAISSTLINNSLTTSMQSLSVPQGTISTIVDDPSIIGSPSLLTSLSLSSIQADYILDKGFIRGFRILFILNTTLTASATLVSVLMIRHKELTRGDEVSPKEKTPAEQDIEVASRKEVK